MYAILHNVYVELDYLRWVLKSSSQKQYFNVQTLKLLFSLF